MLSIKVLLVEDNSGDARLIRELLSDAGANQFSLEHADRLSTGLVRIIEGGIDAILLDLSLPDSHGLDTLARVNAVATGVPIVVLTGLNDETLGLEAVQYGAQDYLIKGHVDSEFLARSLRYAIMRKHLEDQKDNFISVASHELRTPVTIIRGAAQLALRVAANSGNEKLNRTLETINEQTGRMTRLINDLLEAPLVQNRSISLCPEPFDLCRLVQEVVKSFESTIPGFSFALELPPIPATVNADSHRIEQVITNLIHNAINYSPGSQKVEIAVKLADNEVITTVRDYGVGIPADQQSQVFKRFFRGRNVDTEHHGGLGLSLFIAHGVLSRHGGRMWLQSTEGQGSTFYFALPLVQKSEMRSQK